MVATPIGNLGDLSPRAAEALRTADARRGCAGTSGAPESSTSTAAVCTPAVAYLAQGSLEWGYPVDSLGSMELDSGGAIVVLGGDFAL